MRDLLLTIQAQIEDHVDEHQHGTVGIDSLIDTMFGFEHVVAEFFWNGVFLLLGFCISRAVAWRKIHKYIDDKHGVRHQKDEY
jgi:hypothetical protein